MCPTSIDSPPQMLTSDDVPAALHLFSKGVGVLLLLCVHAGLMPTALLGTAVGAAVVYGIDEGDPMAVQKKVGVIWGDNAALCVCVVVVVMMVVGGHRWLQTGQLDTSLNNLMADCLCGPCSDEGCER